MRILKMRRIRRKYSPKRRRFRRRIIARSKKPEVKFFTKYIASEAVQAHYDTTKSTTLFQSQKIYSDLLSEIVQGTDYTNRVGNRIFVKKITCKYFIAGCPSTSSYNVDQFYIRHILHNDRTVTTVNVLDFFETGTYNNFIAPIDRKRYAVHYDKVIKATPGATPTGALVPNNFSGSIKYGQFSLYPNREVEFTKDGDIKNDRDVYSHAALVLCPGINAVTTLYQIGCMDVLYRVYFTDS